MTGWLLYTGGRFWFWVQENMTNRQKFNNYERKAAWRSKEKWNLGKLVFFFCFLFSDKHADKVYTLQNQFQLPCVNFFKIRWDKSLKSLSVSFPYRFPLSLQARLQAKQATTGDRRHHYKGYYCVLLIFLILFLSLMGLRVNASAWSRYCNAFYDLSQGF